MTMRHKREKARLAENGRQPCKNFIHNDGRYLFQPSAGSRPQVQRPGLVTTNYSCSTRAASAERHGESCSTGKIPPAGNRQHYGNLRHSVELVGRNHQHRSRSLLLMPFCRIKRHQINITTPHQISSPPVAPAPVHTPSSGESGAEASHWANSSCRLYFFLTFGSIIRRPDSFCPCRNARVRPDSRGSWRKGGTFKRPGAALRARCCPFRQNLSGRQADKRISGRHHGILGQPGMSLLRH